MSQNLENYLLGKYATKNTYMSKYSGSVAITILTLLTFIVAFGYNHYQAQLKFLKKKLEYCKMQSINYTICWNHKMHQRVNQL